MKCRECSSCYKGYWASAPEAHACIEAKKPFEIIDVDAECVKHQYEPPKHGYWEINCDGYYPYCTVCGYEPNRDKLTEICPQCGSIMDGDRNA